MKYKYRMVVIDVDQGYLENISTQLMERIESVRKKDERIVNITRESSVTDQISYFKRYLNRILNRYDCDGHQPQEFPACSQGIQGEGGVYQGP